MLSLGLIQLGTAHCWFRCWAWYSPLLNWVAYPTEVRSRL